MVGFLRRKQETAFDPATVESQSAALEAVRRGHLQPLLLLPAEFGGAEIPPNTVYVPAAAARAKHAIDHEAVRPMIAEGRAAQYSAVPDYVGASFVPATISITASGPDASFTATVPVWGAPQT